MSYSLIDLPQKNYQRTITNTDPLYVSMGALSAADATTLRIGVVIGAFSGTTAALTLEESIDGGSTWTNVTGVTTSTISGTGTAEISVSASNGPLTPIVRLKLLPAVGTSVRVTSMWRTFVQSNVMVPRDVTVAGAVATEATSLSILAQCTAANATLTEIELDTTNVDTKMSTLIGHVDGLETLIGTTNSTLTTIDGRVDGLETLIGTTNSTLTTIDGRVDGIETLLTELKSQIKPEYAAAYAPIINDFASTGIATPGTWVTIATTTASSKRFIITNSSGAPIRIRHDATEFAYIPPSGNLAVDIVVGNGVVIQVTSSQVVSSGIFTVSAFV